ncbi:MAG: Spy/CpxP family protein refolding chaperone [Salinivirgaceae bacterium]|nr:Spy/CpxP family protein refolding chaperone [Salinivirgaceae bacterium]
MKPTIFIAALLVASMFATTVDAQNRGGGRSQNNYQSECLIPNLTETQQTKIESLRLERMQARNSHRLEMDELRLSKRRMMMTGATDANQINGVIDQMGSKRVEMQKSAAAHRLAVRALLTDEQKVYFDNHGNGRRYNNGNRRGYRNGGGNGNFRNCYYRNNY